MARRKNAPDLVKLKCGVADRLRDLRNELFGDRGGPELARRLGLPVRTWYNYEAGVTVPAEVVLRFMELTSVEPSWLLHGTGPKFRSMDSDSGSNGVLPLESIGSLLRSALERLERGEPVSVGPGARRVPHHEVAKEGPSVSPEDVVLLAVDEPGRGPLTAADGLQFIAAGREWQAAERDHRCIQVVDDEMTPLVAQGAYVAYSDRVTDVGSLDGRLVVAWLRGRGPIVRWFQASGRCALLLAENQAASRRNLLVELQADGYTPQFRVVSWISTPR